MLEYWSSKDIIKDDSFYPIILSKPIKFNIQKEIIDWLSSQSFSISNYYSKTIKNKKIMLWEVERQNQKGTLKCTIYKSNFPSDNVIIVAYRKNGKRFEGRDLEFEFKIKIFL